MVTMSDIVAGVALMLWLMVLGGGISLLLCRKYHKLGSKVPALGALANFAENGINTIFSTKKRDAGAAAVSTTYPDVKSWFSKSTWVIRPHSSSNSGWMPVRS